MSLSELTDQELNSGAHLSAVLRWLILQDLRPVLPPGVRPADQLTAHRELETEPLNYKNHTRLLLATDMSLSIIYNRLHTRVYSDYGRASIEFSRLHTSADDASEAAKYARHSVQIVNPACVVYAESRCEKRLQPIKHVLIQNDSTEGCRMCIEMSVCCDLFSFCGVA